MDEKVDEKVEKVGWKVMPEDEGNKKVETDGVCITPDNPYCPACPYGIVDFPPDFIWEEGGPVKWICTKGCKV